MSRHFLILLFEIGELGHDDGEFGRVETGEDLKKDRVARTSRLRAVCETRWLPKSWF